MKKLHGVFLGVMLCLVSGLVLSAGKTSLEGQLRQLRAQIRKDFGVKLPPLPVPANNPQTQDKIKLGEALFFDPNLSGCGSIACASCHEPEKGFGDGQPVSDGCASATGRRNSNTIYLGAYLSHMFWDGRVQTLEQQALGPVVDPAEMSSTWDKVISYLETGVHPGTGKSFPGAKKFYQTFFKKVFDGEINTTAVTKAIAAYERTATSFDSPYDQWVRGNDKALSVPQKKGLLVFFGRGKCSECHAPPLFTNSDFHNLGVPNAGTEKAARFPHNPSICKGIAPEADPGRAEVGFLQSSCSDVGRFKTPTLRNVALSPPFMHNGKFATLETAIAHYEELAKGTIKPVAGELDPDVAKGAFQFGQGGGEADDLANMVEFMRALNGSQLKSPAGGIAPPDLK